MTYEQWATRHPQAAADLLQVFGSLDWPKIPRGGDGKSEAWSQQQARLDIAHQGAFSWRNNVGATPAKCPDCGNPQQPVRYGLANDSAKLNKQIKSSDLILAIPRIIRPEDVGLLFLQFGSVECKRPGWKYTGTKQEPAQAAWLALISSRGGFAVFSTGGVKL